MNNMCEQLLAIKRIEAVIESRNRLVELQEGLVYVSGTDNHKKLSEAYEKFEQSYADIIIAEAKYLESLKETTEKQEQELTTTKVANEDLKYLRERSTKATLSKGPLQLDPEYGHRATKTMNVNVDFNLDKHFDIDKTVEHIKENIKEQIKENI